MGKVEISVSSLDGTNVEVNAPNLVIELEADPPYPVRGGELDIEELTNEQGAAMMMVSAIVGEDAVLDIIKAAG